MKYQIGLFEIDTSQFLISHGAQTVPVEPKVFDLLVYLIENRQRLVSRDELFNQIWAGREVSDTTLSNHIKTARKALGDNGEQQHIIKTIRGRGYQFIAEVNNLNDAKLVLDDSVADITDDKIRLTTKNLTVGQSAWWRKKQLYTVLLLLLVVFITWWLLNQNSAQISVSDRPYILVLPFDVSGPDQEKWQPFADQNTREVIRNLHKISGLNVIPGTSAFIFRHNKSQAYIREQLPDVRYILSASINISAGSQLQVSAALDDLHSGKQIWSQNYLSRIDDTTFFATQAAVAKSVSEALQIAILDKEVITLAAFPTRNLAAYEFFIAGQQQRDLLTDTSLHKAVELFSAAIALDPNFEAAYIAKADAYRIIMAYFSKPADVLPDVVESVAEALTLNPNSAEARASLGLAYVLAWRWQDAWDMLSQAQKLNPNLVLTELGFALYYSAIGNIEQLHLSLKRANALDPLNTELADWGQWALAMAGEVDEAILWGNEKMRLHPDVGMIFSGASVSASIAGQHERAIQLAKEGLRLDSGASYPLLALAQAYGYANQKDKIALLLSKAKQFDGYLCPYESAITYLLLDDLDKAFQQLNDAVLYRSNCLIFARNDPRLLPVKHDPRYLAVLTRIGLDQQSIARYQQ